MVRFCIAAIIQVVYSDGSTATASNTGTISVASGVTYSIGMEVLRNDLGSANERVSGVTFNGQSIGACNPDGGDYDCTFYNCNSELTTSTYTATSDTINVDLTYTGHSYDCDCDMNDWSCSKEGTVAGRTAMTAVARFTLIPIPGALGLITMPPYMFSHSRTASCVIYKFENYLL